MQKCQRDELNDRLHEFLPASAIHTDKDIVVLGCFSLWISAKPGGHLCAMEWECSLIKEHVFSRSLKKEK